MIKKVMIIDDEQSVCELLTQVLTKANYSASSETDPIKAIEHIYKDKPDCILLDIKMPKISGVELLAKIKEFDASIKVIMITGYGNLENAMESMKLGAFDYITKPFDLEFIRTVVANSLKV
jgi:DNA-binding NtrC family response regulator